MLISLTEYAQIVGKDRSAIQKKCIKGMFKTAKKIGRNWVIDSDEPYIDNRIKSGKYVDWRKKMKKFRYGGECYNIHEVDRLPLIGDAVDNEYRLIEWVDTGIYDCDVYPVHNCYEDNRMIAIGIIKDDEDGDEVRYVFSVRCETAKAKELPKVGDVYDRDYTVAEINLDDIAFAEQEYKDDEKAYIEVYVKNKDDVYEKGVQFEIDNPYYEE